MVIPDKKLLRPIRSYVRREGRMTKAQRDAYETLWPQYGVEPTDEQQLTSLELFGREVPIVVLEIGFGMGHSLAEMAMAQPEKSFLGVEVYRTGVGQLLRTLDEQAITNVRVANMDAVELLKQYIADASLQRVNLYFPDPWPKKRHHKRRLVQPAFLDLLAKKLVAGGVFHMATDWQDYAEHAMVVLSEHPAFANTLAEYQFAPRPAERPETKFEQRGVRLGHGVWDLLFQKI